MLTDTQKKAKIRFETTYDYKSWLNIPIEVDTTLRRKLNEYFTINVFNVNRNGGKLRMIDFQEGAIEIVTNYIKNKRDDKLNSILYE